MAGQDNLIPVRSEEEAREKGRKGGIKSGESRRKRKTLKEELLALLEDGDTQNRISVALVQEALNGNKAGSVTKAFEVLRDTIGEKPVDKVEQVNIDVEYDASVEYIKDLMAKRDE